MDERLSAVLNAGLEETTLPSRIHVRGVRPDIDDLIRMRLLPTELRAALQRSADASEPDKADLTDDEMVEVSAAGMEVLDVKVAAFLQEYRFDPRAAWRPFDPPMTVAQFRRMSLDDKEHLRSFVRRRDEVAALERFRDEPGRDAAGTDGEDVGPEPELVSVASRPRRRVRAR